MRIALIGNTQAQAERLRRLLPFEADILLDDADRASRNAPLEVDVALSIRFTGADAAAVHCRLLHCSGAGTDAISFADLPRGVTVCNVYEHEAPIAEYVLAGILDHEIGLARAVAAFSGEQWGAQFRGRIPHGEAMGKTVGIVGMGRIGKGIAVRARAFGMRIIGINRSGRPVPEADEMFSFERPQGLFERADYVVLACPLTEETRGMVGAEAFARMKPTALLINVARGEVVDEAALHAALTTKRIAGALLDTWYDYPTAALPNPLPSRLGLERLEGVRATPHIAGWTTGLAERRYRFIAENLGRFARGEKLLNVVWRDGAPAEGGA